MRHPKQTKFFLLILRIQIFRATAASRYFTTWAAGYGQKLSWRTSQSIHLVGALRGDRFRLLTALVFSLASAEAELAGLVTDVGRGPILTTQH